MACLSTVSISLLTTVFVSPMSDRPVKHSPLYPGDKVCLVEVVPGKHPAGVHWVRDGEQHGSYIDKVNMRPNPAMPEDEMVGR